MSCGVGLQCAPSKDVVAQRSIHQLTARELRALTIVEGRVAMGWLATHWPGMMPELVRRLPVWNPFSMSSTAMQCSIKHSRWLIRACRCRHGRCSADSEHDRGPPRYGRDRPKNLGTDALDIAAPGSYRIYSVPVGGEGGVKNPNLPPPSRPEDEELEIRPDQRAGVPYPEWNFWLRNSCPIAWPSRGRTHRLEATADPNPRPPTVLRTAFSARHVNRSGRR